MSGVSNRQLLQRLDRHLDSADERWAGIENEIRLSRQERENMRVFTRDLMVRMERLTRVQVKALEDLQEDSAAHRQALLRMLDRLGPGDSPSAA